MEYFFCIGAAKAGTTWLYDQLRTDPHFYFAPEKEIHYFFSRFGGFDRLNGPTRFNKLREYVKSCSGQFSRNLFLNPNMQGDFQISKTISNGIGILLRGRSRMRGTGSCSKFASDMQYACDFSPSTCKIDVNEVREIRRFDQRIKIVYIMRDPVERLWSHLKFHAQFMKMFDTVMRYSRDETSTFIRRHQLDEDGLYGTHLQKFLSQFGRDDVLVMDFSMIGSNPEEFVATIADFLDVARPKVLPRARQVINASERFDLPAGLLDSFKPEMERQTGIVEGLGYAFASAWRKNL